MIYPAHGRTLKPPSAPCQTVIPNPRAALHHPVIAAFLFILLPAPASAATYQIANQTDFNTRRTATYSSGDEILFRRGAIFTGMFAPRGSGTSAAPIRIGTYGTGNPPIINALGTNQAAILLKNVEYWEIDGIEVTNTNGTTADQGEIFGIYVLIDSTAKTVLSHYHISNCHVHDVNGNTGIRYRGAIHVHALDTLGNAPFRLDDVRITGNTIEDCGDVGIGNRSSYVDLPNGNVAQLWTNVYVAHNYIARTGRNGIIGRVSKDAVYEYNTLAETSRHSTGHSLYNFETSGFIAQHNEAFGNIGSGSVDRGGFDADYNSENTTFQYNYSHDNRWFMGIMCRYNKGVIIRYNISQNETEGIYWYGFDDESLLENVVVHNNVHFTSSSLPGVLFNAGNRRPRNTTFLNNIFYFQGTGAYGSLAGSGANVSFRHNLYYNIPIWPHGGDPGARTSDPRFVNPGQGGSAIDMTDPNRLSGYRLQSTSPCIDAGTAVAGVARDFWGQLAPTGSALDIGVFEHQPAPNLPPTVTLTSPANGASVTLPSAISLSATAADSDGSIAKVEFYGDGAKLGEDAAAPYTWTWNAPAGTHTVFAIAQDNTGARTSSASHAVNVISPGSNAPPVVTLTAPLPGARIPTPGRIDFAATASDSDGAILLVEFFAGSTKVGSDTTEPFSFVWFAPSGTHSLTAVALDDDGARSTSAAIPVTVGRPFDFWIADELPGSSQVATDEDPDDDGASNLEEYFQGTRPGLPNSRFPILAQEAPGATRQVHFRRAKNRTGATGRLLWSRDLTTWHESGATSGDLTVQLSETVLSGPAEDPELVEATAALSGPGAALPHRLFFLLRVSLAP